MPAKTKAKMKMKTTVSGGERGVSADTESRPRRREVSLKVAFSAPNIVTYIRILAVPGVLAVMQFDSRRNAFLAAMFFALASITDFLDGYLARRFNMVSMIGKFIDPLADKLMVMGTLLMLIHLGRVSVWIVYVILAREIVVTTLRTVAAGDGLVIAARDLGKQKTAIQMIGIWALLVHYDYPIDLFHSRPIDFHVLGTYFLYVSVFWSLASALEYFVGFFRALASRERQDSENRNA